MYEVALPEETELTGLSIGSPQSHKTGTVLASPLALASDRGQARELNEDSVFALLLERLSDQGDLTVGLFLIADGMGGQVGGERASASAIQAAGESLLREVVLPLAGPSAGRWQGAPIHEAIGHAFTAANDLVRQTAPGGGTTLTAVLLIGRRIYVGHVGDCRLYLVRGRALQSLTRDHSILSRLIELGQIEPDRVESPDNDPRRNALYRAIGQPDELEVDIFSHSLEPGDGLLLCSDGLWGSVSAEAMAETVARASTPAEACRRLIETANAAGGSDNITAILVCPIGPEAFPPSPAAAPAAGSFRI